MASEQHVPAFGPGVHRRRGRRPVIVQAQWRMPGLVVNPTPVDEPRPPGVRRGLRHPAHRRLLSQWVDDHLVMLINANAAPDRKRLTCPRTGLPVPHSTNPI